MSLATRARIVRLRRNRNVQEIADQLNVPVATVVAILSADTGEEPSLPAAPGAVARAYAERLEEIAVPTGTANNVTDYTLGMELDYITSLDSILCGVVSWEQKTLSPNVTTEFWVKDGGLTTERRVQAASFQNTNTDWQVKEAIIGSPVSAAMPFFVARAEEFTITTGFKKTAATGDGTWRVRNQRIWLWEIGPDSD